MEFKDKDGYILETDKEKDIEFIEAMEGEGIPWVAYSGRGMYGRECPSVYCEGRSDIYESDVIQALPKYIARTIKKDSMGLGLVLYTGV